MIYRLVVNQKVTFNVTYLLAESGLKIKRYIQAICMFMQLTPIWQKLDMTLTKRYIFWRSQELDGMAWQQADKAMLEQAMKYIDEHSLRLIATREKIVK